MASNPDEILRRLRRARIVMRIGSVVLPLCFAGVCATLFHHFQNVQKQEYPPKVFYSFETHRDGTKTRTLMIRTGVLVLKLE